jgi:hypothetical protein
VKLDAVAIFGPTLPIYGHAALPVPRDAP